MVCGFNIETIDSPVAKQLKYGLIEYMKSSAFDPTLAVDGHYLNSIFPLIPKAEETKVEGRFKNALLQVNATKNLKITNSNVPWSKDVDQVAVQKEDIAYNVKSDGVWKDDDGSA